MTTRNVVYRMYDSGGTLLYVGSSTRDLDRVMEHMVKPWWREVATITVAHFSDELAARVAEAEAIAAEEPTFTRLPPGVRLPSQERDRRKRLRWAAS